MKNYENALESMVNEPRIWLVTGCAGFIGSHLIEKLLTLGQTVVGLDNFSTGSQENLDLVQAAVNPGQWQNFRFIEGDIRSLETCRRACTAVDVVLHQAALGSVPRSVEDPISSNENNVSGFLNMLVAARDAGVARFVYAASSSTYGDDLQLPKVEGRIGQPLSPYAVTKYVNELYAQVFARNYGLNSIGLRYFNVFGPRQSAHGAYAAVIPTWISALMHNEPVFINGDGKTARDFCYVDNAVQANLLAGTVKDKFAVNQIYNVAVGAQTSLNELFIILRTFIAERYPAVHATQAHYRDFRPGDMRLSLADVGKARRLLGYHPVWRVQQGLKQTIDWHLAQCPDAWLPLDPAADKPRHGATGEHSEALEALTS